MARICHYKYSYDDDIMYMFSCIDDVCFIN